MVGAKDGISVEEPVVGAKDGISVEEPPPVFAPETTSYVITNNANDDKNNKNEKKQKDKKNPITITITITTTHTHTHTHTHALLHSVNKFNKTKCVLRLFLYNPFCSDNSKKCGK